MRTSIPTRSFARLTVGLALSSQCVWAQRGPVPPTSVMVSRAWGNGSLNGSIYLTGHVMLDDGTPPSGPVTIERVCNGAPRVQGYTDHKGRFTFQIGQKAGVTPDASEDSSGRPGTPRPNDMPVGMGPQ